MNVRRSAPKTISATIAKNAKMHHRVPKQRGGWHDHVNCDRTGPMTFRKDVLHHLGFRPGEKIELDKLPDGRVELRAAKPSGTIDGLWAAGGEDEKGSATLDEINEASDAGWADRNEDQV